MGAWQVYDGADADIKLNDVIEFTGVLTFDPEISARSFSRSSDQDPFFHSFMDEDVCSKLPASRVWDEKHSSSFEKGASLGAIPESCSSFVHFFFGISYVEEFKLEDFLVGRCLDCTP